MRHLIYDTMNETQYFVDGTFFDYVINNHFFVEFLSWNYIFVSLYYLAGHTLIICLFAAFFISVFFLMLNKFLIISSIYAIIQTNMDIG